MHISYYNKYLLYIILNYYYTKEEKRRERFSKCDSSIGT